MSRICDCGVWLFGFLLGPAAFAGITAHPPSKSEALGEASALTQAALEAEVLGKNGDRASQLATAMMLDGKYAPAHWHSGQVLVNRQWLPLVEAEKLNAADLRRETYRQQREQAGDDPRLLMNLARWSEKEGFKDEALAHYSQVLMNAEAAQPTKEAAALRLGMQKIDGLWFSKEERIAQQKRMSAMRAALVKWRGRLVHLQLAINDNAFGERERAIQELQRIDDPQVALALESFLPDGGELFLEEAAKMLGRFPQHEATEALVRYAVLAGSSGAHEAAIAGLKARPIHDYMPLLLTGLTTPIKFEVAPLRDQNGRVTVRETLTQEDGAKRLVRVQDETLLPLFWHSGRRYYSIMTPTRPGPLGLAQHATQIADRVKRDVSPVINASNEQSRAINRRIYAVLDQLTPARLPQDVNHYWQWWQQYNEYDGQKPTYYAYQQRQQIRPFQAGCCCFPAGTLVSTAAGLVPIESIKPGDRVLSQDQDTGELGFKVVLRTTTRGTSPTLHVHAGSEDIVTTLGHPFWVDGHGWKMAKELAPGDLLHSVSGAVRVDRIEPAGERSAYNLVVDHSHTYFVGTARLLVHDNEFRQPTLAIVPGLVSSTVGVR